MVLWLHLRKMVLRKSDYNTLFVSALREYLFSAYHAPSTILALTKSYLHKANIQWIDKEGKHKSWENKLSGWAAHCHSSRRARTEWNEKSLWFSIKPWTVNQKIWVWRYCNTFHQCWGKSLNLSGIHLFICKVGWCQFLLIFTLCA